MSDDDPRWVLTLGPSGINWLGRAMLRTGTTSLRATIPVREHKRRRIQKKWLRRYGCVRFDIPPEVIQEGTAAVRAFVYDTRREVRGIDL